MTAFLTMLHRVRVWDLPTRLFHWTLVLLVAFSVVTAKIGGNAIDWHERSGYAILSLLVFRILWGLMGSRYARFASFLVPPFEALRRAREVLSPRVRMPRVGHDPLGGWAVIALLTVLGVQAVTGLFSYDDIATWGPWAKFVSNATSTWLTTVHRYNEKAMYVLITMHVTAIAYYRLAKRESLVEPMITGDRVGIVAVAAEDDATTRLRAVVLAVLVAALVGYLVSL